MRIWSIHPKYLDAKGLVALWRETLLGKKVLDGKTKGYKNHPQLIRFKRSEHPTNAINQYLEVVFAESVKRKYQFDSTKFKYAKKPLILGVTQGQIEYEFEHLKKKLRIRNKIKFAELREITSIEPHPIFRIVPGMIETWEVTS